MREPKNQMLGTMEPPLMQLSVKDLHVSAIEIYEMPVSYKSLVFWPLTAFIYLSPST